MTTEQIVFSVLGACFLGLAAVVWYFIQRQISRADTKDEELNTTLKDLNTTMNKINTSLEVFQARTTAEFEALTVTVASLTRSSIHQDDTLQDHEIRIKVIESNHQRNHPNG